MSASIRRLKGLISKASFATEVDRHAALESLGEIEALFASRSASPRISDSDAAYWIKHRASIIDAITAAGFKVMSNKNGFWLLNVQDDEPSAEES